MISSPICVEEIESQIDPAYPVFNSNRLNVNPVLCPVDSNEVAANQLHGQSRHPQIEGLIDRPPVGWGVGQASHERRASFFYILDDKLFFNNPLRP